VVKLSNLLRILRIDAKTEINDLTDLKKYLHKANSAEDVNKKLKIATEEFLKVLNEPSMKEK